MNYDKIRGYADLTVLVLGVLVLGYLFFTRVFVYLLPFFVGWLMAFATRPLAARIAARLHLKARPVRLILTVLIYSALLGALVGGVWVLSREVWEILSGLGEDGGSLGDIIAGLGGSGRVLGRLLGEVGDYVADAVYRVAASMLTGLGAWLTSAVSAVPRVLFFLLVSVIASAYFAISLEEVNAAVGRILPRGAVEWLVRLKDGFFTALLSYLRSYLLLLVITFVEMLAGLCLIRAPYPLVMATVIAVLDLLPVIGVGFVLIPWGVWCLVVGRTPFGIGLLVLFAFHTVLRQIIEPRIVGRNLGVHPLLTLLLIYVGYSLFGVLGLLLVPVVTVLVGSDNASALSR